MYKNQLQELAQRSCFNLPSYSCVREGPDHAPRFKATVNFNGETFESPTFCSTLRQAEHAAAEIALNALANRGPSRALVARVLDETGVYKNLLQETAHRAGLNLPVYTTVRSGLGHFPVFSCTAELAGMTFTGEPAKTKKRAQKNAAMAAWSALKQLSRHGSSSCPSLESEGNQEQEQATIARFLTSLQPAESNNSTPNNRRYGQQRSIAICGGSTPPTSSLYSMPYQSYPYSSLSPEMAVYQMWQQGQSLQPSHLLALPVPPAPPPGPQIFPLMQSVFGPDHHLYFPAEQQELIPVGSRITIATSCPSFYFSNHQIPDLISSKSMVTIQEIEEKKTEESSEVSPSEVHNPPVLCYDNTAQIIQEPLQEDDKQKNGTPETKVGNSVQLKGDRTEQFEWASHRSVGPRFRPVESRQQNPHGFDSSQSIHRPHHYPRAGSHRSVRPPSSVVAPVTIRTVGSISSMGHRPQNLATRMPAPPGMRTGFPSCSTGPRGQQMDLGRVPSNLMAPAVRIRSVVPVCSAPPAKKMPSSSQEELLSGREKKSTEDVSTASSEFHKLRM